MARKMYTKQELADAYGIHRNTFTSRLRALGIRTRNRLTPKQIDFIYAELGEPAL